MNDQLHKDALDILKQMKPTSAEQKAKDEASDYDARRREDTARLGEVVSKIWDAFDRNETVGGVAGKQEWCKIAGVKIRWMQRVVAKHRGVLSTPNPDSTNQTRVDAGVTTFLYSKQADAYTVVVGIEEVPQPNTRDRFTGDLTLRVRCKPQERREKVVEIGKNLFGVLKRLRLLTPEFKEEWQKLADADLASLPQPTAKKKEPVRHIRDKKSAVSLCDKRMTPKTQEANKQHPATCEECLKIAATLPPEPPPVKKLSAAETKEAIRLFTVQYTDRHADDNSLEWVNAYDKNFWLAVSGHPQWREQQIEVERKRIVKMEYRRRIPTGGSNLEHREYAKKFQAAKRAAKFYVGMMGELMDGVDGNYTKLRELYPEGGDSFPWAPPRPGYGVPKTIKEFQSEYDNATDAFNTLLQEGIDKGWMTTEPRKKKENSAAKALAAAETANKHTKGTNATPAATAATTGLVKMARIGNTNEFGVFPESCWKCTTANALTIGTRQVCEAERDRINAKRLAHNDSVESLVKHGDAHESQQQNPAAEALEKALDSMEAVEVSDEHDEEQCDYSEEQVADDVRAESEQQSGMGS